MPLAAVIALAVFLAIVVAFVVVLVYGRDPDSRLHPLRVSATEAGERSSDLAAEFFDWLRIGR
jgi:ABC-type uncharacterized transport system permease subunit